MLMLKSASLFAIALLAVASFAQDNATQPASTTKPAATTKTGTAKAATTTKTGTAAKTGTATKTGTAAKPGTAAKSGTTHSTVARKAPVSTGPAKVTGEPIKTPDGLQYWDVKVGIGAEATVGKNVKVNYTGWFTNGKKFDSSIGRGPFEVTPLGSAPVISGWNKGIVGMKVGGKRQLHIPPTMAYGPDGYPGVIPPNSTLIFDVELLSVQ